MNKSEGPKQELRKKVINLLKSQKEDERLTKSKKIKNKLFETEEFTNASNIMFYYSFTGEVETLFMIEEAIQLGKKILLPIVDADNYKMVPGVVNNLDEDLEVGPYGIHEPKKDDVQMFDPEQLDIVIVPGLAFDAKNFRLGRGGGYYDRFLPGLSPQCLTFGLAFDFQMVQQIPSLEAHDVPLTKVLSN